MAIALYISFKWGFITLKVCLIMPLGPPVGISSPAPLYDPLPHPCALKCVCGQWPHSPSRDLARWGDDWAEAKGEEALPSSLPRTGGSPKGLETPIPPFTTLRPPSGWGQEDQNEGPWVPCHPCASLPLVGKWWHQPVCGAALWFGAVSTPRSLALELGHARSPGCWRDGSLMFGAEWAKSVGERSQVCGETACHGQGSLPSGPLEGCEHHYALSLPPPNTVLSSLGKGWGQKVPCCWGLTRISYGS